MKEEKAIPVCPDCNCVMFKKRYQAEFGVLNGWGCPECHITKWEDVEQYARNE